MGEVLALTDKDTVTTRGDVGRLAGIDNIVTFDDATEPKQLQGFKVTRENLTSAAQRELEKLVGSVARKTFYLLSREGGAVVVAVFADDVRDASVRASLPRLQQLTASGERLRGLKLSNTRRTTTRNGRVVVTLGEKGWQAKGMTKMDAAGWKKILGAGKPAAVALPAGVEPDVVDAEAEANIDPVAIDFSPVADAADVTPEQYARLSPAGRAAVDGRRARLALLADVRVELAQTDTVLRNVDEVLSEQRRRPRMIEMLKAAR